MLCPNIQSGAFFPYELKTRVEAPLNLVFVSFYILCLFFCAFFRSVMFESLVTCCLFERLAFIFEFLLSFQELSLFSFCTHYSLLILYPFSFVLSHCLLLFFVIGLSFVVSEVYRLKVCVI